MNASQKINDMKVIDKLKSMYRSWWSGEKQPSSKPITVASAGVGVLATPDLATSGSAPVGIKLRSIISPLDVLDGTQKSKNHKVSDASEDIDIPINLDEFFKDTPTEPKPKVGGLYVSKLVKAQAIHTTAPGAVISTGFRTILSEAKNPWRNPVMLLGLNFHKRADFTADLVGKEVPTQSIHRYWIATSATFLLSDEKTKSYTLCFDTTEPELIRSSFYRLFEELTLDIANTEEHNE